MIYLELIFFLVLILIAAMVFTNAVEHLGARLGISEGVTGSVFAAIGTALPETMIPVLALFLAGGHEQTRAEIGVGAILGAPLLLSTLAMFLMAAAVVIQRTPAGAFAPEPTGLRRDLNFFLPAYLVVALALFVPPSLRWLDFVVVIALVAWYVLYLWRTVRASSGLVEAGHATEADSPLLVSRLKLSPTPAAMVLQTFIGLVLLVWGAEGFIHSIEAASSLWGMQALVLSLLIAPLASEMPEKINSILWVRRRRDTLAFGNVTGAMVYQGTLLPALGIAMTPWQANPTVLASVLASLLASLWLYLMMSQGQLKIWHMVVNGGLYFGYIVMVLTILSGDLAA